MVMSLHNDQCIARRILGGQIPSLLGTATPSANVQALALSQRVERKALMRTEHFTVRGLNRPRPRFQEAPEKFSERTLADETDARAIRLVENRQTRAARALAHTALFQLA